MVSVPCQSEKGIGIIIHCLHDVFKVYLQYPSLSTSVRFSRSVMSDSLQPHEP